MLYELIKIRQLVMRMDISKIESSLTVGIRLDNVVKSFYNFEPTLEIKNELVSKVVFPEIEALYLQDSETVIILGNFSTNACCALSFVWMRAAICNS